jgi:hypothetical protein
MKKTILIIAISIFLFSCSKDDEHTSQPIAQPTTKVIDKIESKIKFGAAAEIKYTYQFSYNANKEITKIEFFNNDSFRYFYTYNYVNNIPTSGQYETIFDAFPAYNVSFNFTNNRYASYFDSQLNDTTNFSYNTQFSFYTNGINGNRFFINETGDLHTRSYGSNGNEYAFTFDQNKKGPLYNVVNKKWIPLLWYGINNDRVPFITSLPLNSVFDDNIAQNNPITNTYDADGFVTKSVFTTENGQNTYETNYIYKNI